MKRVHLLAILVLCVIWVPVIGYGLWRARLIPTNGVVAHVDLSVNVASIDWGICYVDESVSRPFIVTNNGTVPHTMMIYTANWTVPQSLFSFSIDANTTALAVNESVLVNATLLPLLGAQDYPTFAFDIVVWVED